MPPNPTFDSLIATTVDNYREKLADNVFGNRPLASYLKRKDRVRFLNGGVQIVEPLVYAQNSTAKPYGPWDSLDITPQDSLTAAVYPWRQFAASIAVSGLEELQNSGEEEIIDLLESKVMVTEESITSSWNIMFYNDGTTFGGSANANTWLGLAALVGDNAVGPATVGGINCTTAGNEFWRSVVKNGSTWDTATEFLDGMRSAYNSAARGSDAPDAVWTHQDQFEAYESYLEPQLRFTDTKTLDAGFQNLLFKTAPMMFDADIPAAGDMIFTNSKYIKLVGHKREWFKPTPFIRPPNQNAMYSQILCTGNLTTNNRKRHARIHSLP